MDNGGIPADWKPPYTPPLKSEPLSQIEELILAAGRIAENVRDIPDERNSVNGVATINWYRVSLSSSVWVDLVKAYDKVKFK